MDKHWYTFNTAHICIWSINAGTLVNLHVYETSMYASRYAPLRSKQARLGAGKMHKPSNRWNGPWSCLRTLEKRKHNPQKALGKKGPKYLKHLKQNQRFRRLSGPQSEDFSSRRLASRSKVSKLRTSGNCTSKWFAWSCRRNCHETFLKKPKVGGL